MQDDVVPFRILGFGGGPTNLLAFPDAKKRLRRSWDPEDEGFKCGVGRGGSKDGSSSCCCRQFYWEQAHDGGRRSARRRGILMWGFRGSPNGFYGSVRFRLVLGRDDLASVDAVKEGCRLLQEFYAFPEAVP